MPFKSKAQQRFLYSKHPDIAEEFSENMTHEDFERLPQHARSRTKKNQHLKDLTNKHLRKKTVR